MLQKLSKSVVLILVFTNLNRTGLHFAEGEGILYHLQQKHIFRSSYSYYVSAIFFDCKVRM